MRPPFASLSRSRRRRAFFAALLVTFVVGAGLSWVGGALATDAAPRGIVSFELARDLPTSEAILDSWDENQRIRAGITQGADFLFLIAYPLALALACGLVAEHLRPRWARLGALLAWGQLAAGALDAVENLALIALLLGAREPQWAWLAWACAVPKFALVTLGLGYVGLGGLAALLARERS